MGIENLHIKEGAASALVPKLLGLYVQPCFTLNIRGSQGNVFPVKGWRVGSMANLGEELSGDIPNAVMPNRREGSFGAAQGMVDRKGNTTWAMGRESGWLPTILDTQGIPESLFV